MTDAAANPQAVLDRAPMSRGQWLAVTIAIMMYGLDGYDAGSISFAAPGMTAEWGLAPDAVGWVLSMELIGMGVGSLLFGNLADRYGRRPTILGCQLIMILGMAGAAMATDVVQLSAVRVLTGLGIGGMLPAIAAIVAEHSNERQRSLMLSLMFIGYPLGLVLGGLFARNLIQVSHWSSVFTFGAIITAIALPLVWAAVPESVAWLARKQPKDALGRTNAVMRRFGHAEVAALPPVEQPASGRGGTFAILRPPLARVTILLTLAYVAHVTCLYFILKWVPPLVVGMGFTPLNGADVLLWTMIGATAAGPLFAMATRLTPVRTATLVSLGGSAISVWLFTHAQGSLPVLMGLGALAGLLMTAAAIGFYSLLATAYPAELRAGGIGFGIGVGRAGASLGPALAGILFAAGFLLPQVGLFMGAGCLLSLVLILILGKQPAPAPAD
jgi:benzoate transport